MLFQTTGKSNPVCAAFCQLIFISDCILGRRGSHTLELNESGVRGRERERERARETERQRESSIPPHVNL